MASSTRSPLFTASAPPLLGAIPKRHAAPERWDKPFSPDMKELDVDLLLAHPLFASTKPDLFPILIPLRGILKNDCRIRVYQPGEVIVRQGDYGHSAFLILDGEVRIFLNEQGTGRSTARHRTRAPIWTGIRRWWNRAHYPEQVKDNAAQAGVQMNLRGEVRIFLQDVPGVLTADRTALLGTGEMFGEMAAIGRTPRTSTIVAERRTQTLEIRWQGLREIRKYSPEWKLRIDQVYRERSLQNHLRETPLFRHLPEETLQVVADATRFEVFGEFEWQHAYQRVREAGERERLEQEPLIAREGDYPNGLLLIRSGFARVSTRYNHGERTESYLGKGDAFGLEEIMAGWRGQVTPLRRSLRALGYVDVLFIPTAILEQHVFPRLPPGLFASLTREPAAPVEAAPVQPHGRANSFLEFIVAQRFINGRAAMLIDLDRCTRCDDCVRACAATHDNNPRFIRQGPESGGVMVASACMHCVDPVCMIGCPTGAIHRASHDGEVEINPDTCIGCGVCAQSCPYGTIQMVPLRDEDGLPLVTEETGAPIRRATKCDLCVDQAGGPACASACPHDALVRADLRGIEEIDRWFKR